MSEPAACDCPTCTEAAARPGMAQVTHVESAAQTWDEFVERVSRELYDAGIRHHIDKKPGHTLSLNIGGIASFSSVRELAEALEQVGADFAYSARWGFTLSRKGVAA